MAGRIITVAQQKGGSGKTTLTSNLAVAMALKGRKTAILDTDPQGSLGRWFMNRVERLGDADVDLGFRTASAWGARYEARELAKTYDYVLIDTPPKMGIDGRPAVEVADIIVVPVSPSPLDIWATEPIIELAKTEKKLVLIVVNRTTSRARITGEVQAVLKTLDCLCAETLIGNRVIYAETSGSGHGVVERRPNGPAATEIKSLLSEIEKSFS